MFLVYLIVSPGEIVVKSRSSYIPFSGGASELLLKSCLWIAVYGSLFDASFVYYAHAPSFRQLTVVMGLFVIITCA